MKAILLALAAGALLFAVGTWQLCRVPGGKGAGTWLLIYFAILPVFAAVHLLTPPDLGVLPSAFQIPIPIIDLGFSFFLYTAGFFGGVLQLLQSCRQGIFASYPNRYPACATGRSNSRGGHEIL